MPIGLKQTLQVTANMMQRQRRRNFLYINVFTCIYVFTQVHRIMKGAKMSGDTKTNSDGTYSGSPGSGFPVEGVKADYAGDSEHMPAHAAFSLKG